MNYLLINYIGKALSPPPTTSSPAIVHTEVQSKPLSKAQKRQQLRQKLHQQKEQQKLKDDDDILPILADISDGEFDFS